MGASCRRTNDGTSRMTPPRHHTACLPVVDRTVMICAVDRRVPAARTKVIEWLRGLGLGKIVAVGIRRWTGSVPSPDVGQERFEDHRHDGRPPQETGPPKPRELAPKILVQLTPASTRLVVPGIDMTHCVSVENDMQNSTWYITLDASCFVVTARYTFLSWSIHPHSCVL